MPKDWRKAKVKKCKEEELGSYQLSLPFILGNVMEKLILQTICRYIKDDTITRSSQHGFSEVKLCLTNMINFCNEVTGLVDKESSIHCLPGL